MLMIILISAITVILAGYRFYGRFLERRFEISDGNTCPSHSDYDGVDRVPANKSVLLGHHFSSIAGAGPIVGPIIASIAFGWLPTLFWVLIGSIFIGGVHDFSALVASVRHKARSIAEIAREYMTPLAYKFLLIFIWLSLVYVLTVFTDLTSATFVQDGGVASSSIMFMVLAVVFGFMTYRFKIPVLWASIICVPLVFLAVWAGQHMPLNLSETSFLLFDSPAKTWGIILVIYCFIASTTPVWALLQPRDYLSSYLLYASLLGGFLGIVFGGGVIEYPAFTGWTAPNVGALFPILFITVACGACSGFHSVVASGTTSKQIDRESDARLVGYGSMLIEGIVAVIALSTVAIIAKGDPLTGRPPLEIYGAGMGKFLSVFGVPERIGFSFGVLALSTFILTTLDTATRLGRYIFEEFFGSGRKHSRYVSTLATLALPAFFVLITLKGADGRPMPAWKAIWPVFGATNQLLAGLALLVILVWFRKTGKKAGFLYFPLVFMNLMTLWALIILITQYGFSVIGVIAIFLLVLAAVLLVESVRILRKNADNMITPSTPQ